MTTSCRYDLLVTYTDCHMWICETFLGQWKSARWQLIPFWKCCSL